MHSTSYSAAILGIQVVNSNLFEDYEVVPISRIDCPLALIPIHSRLIQRDLWVCVSFDHVNFDF
jgi:hypothetical protein